MPPSSVAAFGREACSRVLQANNSSSAPKTTSVSRSSSRKSASSSLVVSRSVRAPGRQLNLPAARWEFVFLTHCQTERSQRMLAEGHECQSCRLTQICPEAIGCHCCRPDHRPSNAPSLRPMTKLRAAERAGSSLIRSVALPDKSPAAIMLRLLQR